MLLAEHAIKHPLSVSNHAGPADHHGSKTAANSAVKPDLNCSNTRVLLWVVFGMLHWMWT